MLYNFFFPTQDFVLYPFKKKKSRLPCSSVEMFCEAFGWLVLKAHRTHLLAWKSPNEFLLDLDDEPRA